jgi:hypothetical protein
MDCLSHYLYQSKEGSETELYGYALHIEVVGEKGGQIHIHILNLMALQKAGKAYARIHEM